MECARCGDGPLLTGTLAAPPDQHAGTGRLPDPLPDWLTEHGWQPGAEPICPHHQHSGQAEPYSIPEGVAQETTAGFRA